MFNQDPGLCPVCGAAHAACTSGSGPIVMQQLPARDAMAAAPLVEELPAESEAFSTATYRGRDRKGRVKVEP